jgi:hypothetical protein
MGWGAIAHCSHRIAWIALPAVPVQLGDDGMKHQTSKPVSNFARGMACALLALATSTAGAAEQVVRNDTLDPPAIGSVVGDFAVGEMGAAVLTSPCDGSIVAVQILWDSQLGGGDATLEENIWIFGTGAPSGTGAIPATTLLQLEGPLMTPGFLNEFRFIDEAGTIPIDVPVTTGQSFTVALQYGVATDIVNGSASVLSDANGCQSGLNYLYGNFGLGTAWWDFCTVGLSGDLIIRVIVDCPDPEGACCAPDGSCADNVEAGNCTDTGEIFHQGELCANVSCPLPTGACCSGGGGCLDGLDQLTCEDAPITGTYAGDGTACVDQVCDVGRVLSARWQLRRRHRTQVRRPRRNLRRTRHRLLGHVVSPAARRLLHRYRVRPQSNRSQLQWVSRNLARRVHRLRTAQRLRAVQRWRCRSGRRRRPRGLRRHARLLRRCARRHMRMPRHGQRQRYRHRRPDGIHQRADRPLTRTALGANPCRKDHSRHRRSTAPRIRTWRNHWDRSSHTHRCAC